MRYFDFHAHIILKQLFDDNPNIDAIIKANDIRFLPKECTSFPNIIQSQINQGQLANLKDEVIVGVALYSLESNLAKVALELRNNLKPDESHKLSESLLNNVISGTYRSFTDFLITRTLDLYLNAPLSFNVLNKSSFDSALPLNKVNIFFVIEGCHSLVDSINQVSLPGKVFSSTEILANLDEVLKKVTILSVNITHLQFSNLCNQAFGMQIADLDLFYPLGSGIAKEGKEVIQGLFSRGICVDIKHMSYKSRMELREGIENGEYKNVQPIICTHTGFTGIPFNDYSGYILDMLPTGNVYYVEMTKTRQIRNVSRRSGSPAFNMSTINLFNEEIEWLVKNGGFIGISLDRRILGYVDSNDHKPTGRMADNLFYVDKEYFSRQEWADLGLNGKTLGYLIDEDDCMKENDVEENTETNGSARDSFFYNHVLFHLKHYFQVCVNADIAIEQAQKQIVIGSDFDGIINPFINCNTVENIPSLKNYIKTHFKDYLNSLADSGVWAAQLDVENFVEDLFYNNGFNFVKSFFTR